MVYRGALFTRERHSYHRRLLEEEVLTLTAAGVASNADGDQKASRLYAAHIADALGARVRNEKLAGQTAGERFESVCAEFAQATFLELGHLRPGTWKVEKMPGRRAASGVARFEQYSHLADLDEAVRMNQSLRAILGNDYGIAPDVVISRSPMPDSEINAYDELVDDTVARKAAIRRANQPLPILHAVISCKWTLRTDRAQNARSEALNLIRNRKGRLPHVAVVTGEPTPARISSLALGTGDIDCVYHFALPELVAAVDEHGADDAVDLLNTMITGNRLKDIADLPLDLAV
ncbi:NgoMIV family type II restriction endonuclease [Actinomycetospora atypica]|uniref:NgoMIV family type II restriction endonuclease n=1 Tax=Actinomycetospora atypica TaxID=1290095 RepID=A0ABV9YID3_9PSEU